MSVDLQKTLAALRLTPKGKLGYNSDSQDTLGQLALTSTLDKPQIWGSDLTFHRLLTINCLPDDDLIEGEDEEITPTRYYLDQDNRKSGLSRLNCVPLSDTTTNNHLQALTTTVETTSTSISSTAISKPSSLEKSNTSSFNLSLSCASPEDVQLHHLNAKYQRELEIKIAEKTAEVISGFKAIDEFYTKRFEELRFAEEEQKKAERQWWDDQLDRSYEIFKEEEKRLKQASREASQKVIRTVAQIKKDQVEQTEKALKEEEERQMKERKRVIAECKALLEKISDSERELNEGLNSKEFDGVEVAKPFVQNGKGLCVQIMERVKRLSSSPSLSAPAKLEDCLKTLRSLTARVHEQREQMKRSNFEVERLQKQKEEKERELVLKQMLQQQLEEEKKQALLRKQQQEAEEKKHDAQQEAEQKKHDTQQRQREPERPSVQSATSLHPKPLSEVGYHEDTIHEFARLSDLVKRAQEAGKLLSSNPQTKRLRIEILKAVSITINSISEHEEREKFTTLSRLIRGETVQIGRESMSTHGHPEAILFCQNIIAKKLVEQADSQVSVNAKAAFPFATVIISLMNDSELMKDLILAYFYIQCPYLIPYYPAKQESQTTEEYFSSLGYKISNSGDIEAQDLFIKRISGLTKLFSSCLISKGIGRSGNTRFSIEHGWVWLARLVSLRPHPATTATVLTGFLSVCGRTFVQIYGRQAYKMLRYLRQEYIPLIREVGSEGDGGATERLELSLDELIQTY